MLRAQQVAENALPDSPGATLFLENAADAAPTDPEAGQSTGMPIVAPKYRSTIQEGQRAQPLSPEDKLVLGLRHSVTLSAFGSSLVSAGWSHGWDSRPHYGTDSAGFGERLGASALKGATQNVFVYGVWANVFHQDPRYYVIGHKKGFVGRAVYAAERTFVTRTDSGTTAVNWTRFAGIVSANALANTYYPERDRTVGRTATACVTGLGTTVLSNEISEFLHDALHLVFHKKQ